MRNLMQGEFQGRNQEHFDRVEQEFKPSLTKFNLKPPKATNAHIQRTKLIANNNSNKTLVTKVKRPLSA
jgi:short subunit dehydrogenase-like uncharacterized protein